MNQYMEANVPIVEVPAMAMGKDENVLALWSAKRAANGTLGDEFTLFPSPGVSGWAGGQS